MYGWIAIPQPGVLLHACRVVEARGEDLPHCLPIIVVCQLEADNWVSAGGIPGEIPSMGRLNQAALHGEAGEFGAVFQAEFAHDVGPVEVYCFNADKEGFGRFLIGVPFGQQH